MREIKETDNNNLKPLNKNQKWFYKKIMRLGKNEKVRQISYDELFSVLDRVKFCYFLSALNDEYGNKILKNLINCKGEKQNEKS